MLAMIATLGIKSIASLIGVCLALINCFEAMRDLDPKLLNEVGELLAAGRKVQAIKRVREETGMGLAESKVLVDKLMPARAQRAPSIRQSQSRPAALPAALESLLGQGKKVDAMTLFKEVRKLGFGEALRQVQSFVEQHPELRQRKASERSPSRPGPVQREAMPQRGRGLPARVQGLLRQGREADAARMLRKETGVGIQEARREIAAYIVKHPELRRLNPRGGNGAMWVAVILTAALFSYFALR